MTDYFEHCFQKSLEKEFLRMDTMWDKSIQVTWGSKEPISVEANGEFMKIVDFLSKHAFPFIVETYQKNYDFYCPELMLKGEEGTVHLIVRMKKICKKLKKIKKSLKKA